MAGKELVKQGIARRKQIVKFVGEFRSEHSYGPTIAEVAKAVGLGSANATRHHLMKLVEDGTLIMDQRVGRSIDLAKQPVELLTAAQISSGTWSKNARFAVVKGGVARPRKAVRELAAVS